MIIVCLHTTLHFNVGNSMLFKVDLFLEFQILRDTIARISRAKRIDSFPDSSGIFGNCATKLAI